MKTTLIAFIVLFIAFSVQADILNVPQNYSSIQNAIDASQNGDMVLVAEGTYYENINFKGKAITVASHYILEQDTSYISKTIIDGSQHAKPDSGSVVYFVSGEDTTSVIMGFTITGGTGTYNPTGVNSFAMRIGGGILCFNSSAKIEYNIIKYNSLEIELADAFAMGGGIFCGPPFNPGLYTIIDKNIIWENKVITRGNSYTGETSWAQGGGIVILYNGLVTENEIYSNHCESTNALAVGGGVRIVYASIVNLMNNLIQDNSAVSVYSHAAAGGISCSAANAIIDSNRITNNYVAGALNCRGAAIYFDLDNGANWAVVKNNFISDNYYTNGICYGGAIGMYTSSPDIYNNIITNNSADYGGAFHAFNNSKPKIVNNTISGNIATQVGGALYAENSNTHVFLMNSILWNNTSSGTGHEFDSNNGSTISTVFCDIQGGWAGEGNMNVDPLFSDTLFHLSDSSRCIGAGIASYNFSGTVVNAPEYDFDGNIRPDPEGSQPDIGACENPLKDPIDAIEKKNISIPDKFDLLQNYPNPFNPSTVISWQLAVSSQVDLSVYNILGQKVAVLVSEKQPVGTYKIEWNANEFASGVYLYRLATDKGFVETKKLILIK